MSSNTGELTAIAMKAFSLADMFRLSFMTEAVKGEGGTVTYKVELTQPDGPSTGGGMQSLQPIKLVPQSGPTIVVGTVNSVEMVAELRTFEHLAAMHAQRFKGAAIPLDKTEYRALQKKLQDFFTERKIAFKLVEAPTEPPVRRPVEPAPSTMGTIALAVGIVLVLLAAGIYFYLRATHR